jgi:hypothetical protein
MLSEASMQQLPGILLRRSTSSFGDTSNLQPTASVVVGAIFVPLSDVTSISNHSLSALNGWKGSSEFNFDASPEDDVGCRCAGMMIDMGGNVMRKWSNSTCRTKRSVAVESSNWQAAERGRTVSLHDIIAVTYTPHHSSSSSCHAAAVNFGSWCGGVIEIRVEGGEEGFSCCGEVPEGNVPGEQHLVWNVTQHEVYRLCNI